MSAEFAHQKAVRNDTISREKTALFLIYIHELLYTQYF